MTTRGITFDEIDHAYDILNLHSFQTLDGIKIPISKNTNKPEKGDILVWGKDEDIVHGHIAIVVDSKDNGNLFIAEQNWENKEWEGNYSRMIRIEIEPHLIGWIKIKPIL